MEGYHVENFGCRASQADGQAIGAELFDRGVRPASGAATADVVVVNTCSVTAQADRTSRAFLRRLRRLNPTARILVTGCYAQRAPEEVAALAGVDMVVGNSHKALVAQLAEQLLPPASGFVSIAALQPQAHKTSVYVDDAFAHSEMAAFNPERQFRSPLSTSSTTRPNLKVQDGCGNRCSFCIIPTTRGHSRSIPLETCLRQTRAFAAGGGQELVLSGINLGRWGRDLLPRRSLEDLIGAILNRTSLPRLRLSSIEPMDCTSGLLELFRIYSAPPNPRLARHAHLPLQSGSDQILRAMHRRYRPWHYAEKLRALREAMPDGAIGADVMVGFPGESEPLFEESFAFVASQPFTYLHLFPFSPRPGTPAWESHGRQPVPPPMVASRMERFRELIAAKHRTFQSTFLGRELPAVTLHTAEEEQMREVTRALTDNYLEVKLDGRFSSNQSVRAIITGIEGASLRGRVKS